MSGQTRVSRFRKDVILPWLALGFGALVLLAGIHGLGLWDPWEMNHSAVARRMSTPQPVLVIQATPDSSIAQKLKASQDKGLSVETITARGSDAMDRLRDLSSDKIYAAIVIETASLNAAPDGGAPDPATIKSLANTFRSVAGKNLSTRLILASDPSDSETKTLHARILEAADSVAAEDRVPGMDQILLYGFAGSQGPDYVRLTLDAVDDAASTAQFKSSGRTQFLPPLEPWMTSVWYRLFGYNEFSSRLTGALFGLMTLLLLFFPARRLFGDKVTTVTILILGTSWLFTGTARFAGAGMPEIFAVTLGAVSFGRVNLDHAEAPRCKKFAWWVVLGLAVVVCWLAGGMTTVVTLAAIAGAWFLMNPGKGSILSTGLVLGLTGLLALATFLPDSACMRQFRFTAATFSGGVTLEARSFDFIIKGLGFGFFPWSAFIPVSIWAALSGQEDRRSSRLLLLMWAVVPLLTAMIFVRPFNQTTYLGLPAMALLTALFAVDLKDDGVDSRLRTRLFGFFVAGLFLVMMKDMLKSPAPLVSFLTTDPMFSKPGQGDGGFPAAVGMHAIGKLSVALMLLSILAVTAEASNVIRAVVRFLAGRRNFLIVLGAMILLVIIDISVFVSMKWRIITGGGDRAGSELLRIFLTGPDILALYLLTGLVVLLHFWDRVAGTLGRLLGRKRFEAADRWFDSLQTVRVQKVVFCFGAVLFGLTMLAVVHPELSRHLSQKHIVDTWKKAAEIEPGKLYRHGAFSTKGSDDSNFYTSGLDEIQSRNDVTTMLGDSSTRTFFLLPTRQFSEINSAWRDVTGKRGLPVLDDRSSRIVLATSRLASTESDRNWLAKATMTRAEFDALPDVERFSVNFEDSLEIVGFKITPQAITRGTNPELKVFYQVNKRVSKSYRVFMHVDRVGASTRIHGDHWILNLVPESEDQDDCIGCYATNHWKKGDIIVDTYTLSVPIGSPSGDYDIWMGLYVPGGNRMKVKSWDESKIRNDGSDRVRIGRMTIR